MAAMEADAFATWERCPGYEYEVLSMITETTYE